MNNKVVFFTILTLIFLLSVIGLTLKTTQPVAPVPEALLKNLPYLKYERSELNLTAQSAYSLYVLPNGNQKILYEKNSKTKLPIASITKLMTALIVEKYFDKEKIITISEEAERERGGGNIKAGQTYTIGNLLYPLLIESSNDTAFALASDTSYESFVGMMNSEARRIKLQSTNFLNPSGLDEGTLNVSTVTDIANLATRIMQKYPHIFEITTEKNHVLRTSDGFYVALLENTNRLLFEKKLPLEIIGGKTGETPQAKQALLILTKSPNEKGFLVHVVLMSDDRFSDMTELIDWVYNSYHW